VKGERIGAGQTIPVRLTVNGARRTASVNPRSSLLGLLRGHLALTGAKKGRDHGQRAACTVLPDRGDRQRHFPPERHWPAVNRSRHS
jgi:xanthine dehydrogenase YagT iron-sulfur-binding subunit